MRVIAPRTRGILLLALCLFVGKGEAGDLEQAPLLDILHPANSVLIEEFPIGSTTSGNIGTHGWLSLTIGSAPAPVRLASEAHHPSLLTFATNASATQGQGGVLSLGGATGTAGSFLNLGNLSGWEAAFIFRLGSTANIRIRAGLLGDINTGPPTTGIWVRFDTAAGFTDSTFVFECRNSGTGTTRNSGVAADASFHTVRMRSPSPGTVAFSIDGRSELTVSSNCPTGQISPAWQVLTDTSAQKSVDVDRFSIALTGLSR